MKKILVLAFVKVAALSVKAQVYVGGSAGLWHNSDADFTSYNLAPEVGYSFNGNMAVGATLGFARVSFDKDISEKGFYFAPYFRYFFYENRIISLFAEAGIGLSTTKVKHSDSDSGFEIGLKPGLAIKLSDNFSLVSKIGFLGYRDDYVLGSDGYGFQFRGEDITFGFYYTF